MSVAVLEFFDAGGDPRCQETVEIRRGWADQRAAFVASRMGERQKGGVQERPHGLVGPSTSVKAVAGHGVAYSGEVDSDLMGAAGQEPTLEERQPSGETVNNSNGRVRRPAAGARDEPPLVFGVTVDRSVHLLDVERGVPLHDRQVAAVNSS